MHPDVSIDCSFPEPRSALIAIGSNRGDRLGMLRDALDEIDGTRGCRVVAVSSIYATDPVDAGGGEFLNAAARIATTLAPIELLERFKSIETSRGRTGSGRDARTIDIDIIFFENASMDSPRLTIPHPRWSSRRFVTIPLSEVCGDLIDPLSGRPIRDLPCMVGKPGADVRLDHIRGWWRPDF